MVSSRLVGLSLLTVSPAATLGYIFLLVYYRPLTLQISVLIIAGSFFGLLSWIGYTLLTEPPAPKPTTPSELDNLEPETINEKKRIDPVQQKIESRYSVIVDAKVGQDTVIRDHVNLYKCIIGRECKIESFVYIEEGAVIGDRCKIKPNVFIPTGVSIGNDVFIGPNVTFTNDKYPKVDGEWQLLHTTIGDGTSIGAHSVVLPGLRIGRDVIIGAGSVVTKDVPDNTIVYGNPARAVAELAFSKR